MSQSDKEKAAAARAGLLSFLGQFGEPDPYNKIVLEVLFEEMIKHEGISVSGEKGQNRSQSARSSKKQ